IAVPIAAVAVATSSAILVAVISAVALAVVATAGISSVAAAATALVPAVAASLISTVALPVVFATLASPVPTVSGLRCVVECRCSRAAAVRLTASAVSVAVPVTGITLVLYGLPAG